jgi:hypothetical protein
MTLYYRDLSVGTATITASAEGRTPATQFESIVFNARVASVTWARIPQYLRATLSVLDAAGAPISTATLNATIVRDGIQYANTSASTDSAGQATFSLYRPPHGCYTLTMNNVGAPGWDGVTPTNRICI